jgi:hypothetical protein
MTKHKAVFSFALICAALFCAVVTQSVPAAQGINTTPYTCVEKAGGDFKDAHCNEKVSPGTGKFGHVPITIPTLVEVINSKIKNATKESTPAILKGELAGAKLEIICSTVSGEGELAPEEPEAKKHLSLLVAEWAIKWLLCKIIKPAKCTVKEPIEFRLAGEGVEALGPGKNEMGLEFRPAKGKALTTITLEGAECALKGLSFEVQGTAIATGVPAPTEKHTGATQFFTNAMTKETVSIGGKPAEISSAITLKKLGLENAIALTTAT